LYDPHEFLKYAQTLSTRVSNETEARICIGRAYFAAHLLAREKMRAHYLGFEPQGGCVGEHEIVRGLFVDIDRQDISNQLGDLLELRVVADYHLKNIQQSAWTNLMENAFQLCKFIVESLEEV
jgi:hypothetical protein